MDRCTVAMWKGVCLALGNLAVLACLIAGREQVPQTVFYVGFYGAIPAALVGALCGALASAFPRCNVALRHAMIMLPAASLVVALATLFHMERHIFMANIPTLACCVILERWTRGTHREEEQEEEQVPTARVA